MPQIGAAAATISSGAGGSQGQISAGTSLTTVWA